ncbi:hypothetical protein [Microbulbifer sp. TRSA007]|uniref:hypothetical protein n=1 Tax=Microbulbifer sp. TRSA007 TaxID=3243384 RepID=UPI0040396E91
MGLKAVLVGLCTIMLVGGCATKSVVDDEGAKNDLAGASTGNTESSESRLVCKVRSITGSRFKEKTCMTVEEWQSVAEDSKNMVDSARRKGAQGNPNEY